jgi:hypothetical protein
MAVCEACDYAINAISLFSFALPRINLCLIFQPYRSPMVHNTWQDRALSLNDMPHKHTSCVPSGTQAVHEHYRLEIVGPDHPERASLQQFISQVFFQSYGAQVQHFCPYLMGCKDSRGQWLAALGYTPAAQSPLFLEHYLDCPIEQEVAARIQTPTGRDEVVEVGNLAATHAGAARALIRHMTRYLHHCGFKWVTFTATVGLLNSFMRLRMQPAVLAMADPTRLPDKGVLWGRYYDTQPQVMMGDIAAGYAQLDK